MKNLLGWMTPVFVLLGTEQVASAQYLSYAAGNVQVIGRIPAPWSYPGPASLGLDRLNISAQVWGTTPLHEHLFSNSEWSSYKVAIDAGTSIIKGRTALLDITVGATNTRVPNSLAAGTGGLRFTTEHEWWDTVTYLNLQIASRDDVAITYLVRGILHSPRRKNFMGLVGGEIYGFQPFRSSIQFDLIDVAPRVGGLIGGAWDSGRRARGEGQVQFLIQCHVPLPLGQFTTPYPSDYSYPYQVTGNLRIDFTIFSSEKRKNAK